MFIIAVELMHNLYRVDNRMHHHRFRWKKAVDDVGDNGREDHAGDEKDNFISLLLWKSTFFGFHLGINFLVVCMLWFYLRSYAGMVLYAARVWCYMLRRCGGSTSTGALLYAAPVR